MTEVPDYLMQRSSERRAALGGDEASAAPAVTEATSPGATASTTPVAATAPEIEQAEPPQPVPPWVEAARDRKKIPVWMAPVALFLPIWGFMIWATLEEPTRESGGAIAAGGEIYQRSCAACHGVGGGGGIGYQLNDGEVVVTFPDVGGHVAWVINATQNSQPGYGDPDRAGGQRVTGARALMPGFRALGSEAVVEVVLYERLAHGLASEAALAPYILWAEQGGLPEWELGVSPQAIEADFQEFVASNSEAQEMVRAAG